MPRYEYLVLKTNSNVVFQANGTPVGTPAQPGGFFGGGTAGNQPFVYDYLNHLGAAGWEVVTSFGQNNWQIILKRRLP